MEKVKITEVCDFQGGTQPPKNEWKSEISDGYIRMLQIRDFTQREKNYVEYIKEKITTKKCEPDDILIGRYGASIGKICTGLEGAYNVALIKTIPNNKKLTKKFLFYILISDSFQNFIINVGSRAAQAGFNKEDLENFQIPLPNLSTQQKIANILDKADELRQYNKQLIEKYDALTQSLFLDMFGDPVRNEKGWEVKSLGEITDLITDGKHGNCNDEPGSGYYFVSAKDIRNNKINYTYSREIPKFEFEEVDKRTNLQPGDLVMINTGATIGRMAIAKDIPETRRSTFQKSVAVIKVKNDVISSFFLQFVIELGLKTFANMGSGSAIKNLLLSEMRRFNIIVPTLSLQNQFAERVQLIETQKQQAQEALAKSELLFQGLLQQAFNGELN
jgi:type I restriction enzyme S subunit